MCLQFILLKTPVRSSKRFENFLASVKVRFSLSPAKMSFPGKYIPIPKNFIDIGAFPGFYCPPTQCSPASAIARSSCPTAGAEIHGKCYS